MSELKVSVSGIRGIWNQSLTLSLLSDYTQAFGRYVLEQSGKRVLLGRDARTTGALISSYCASILNAMGMDVDDAGIVPTPTVLYGVRQGYDAGLIITASHNPPEWNALKFVKKGGFFTGEKDLAVILKHLGKTVPAAQFNKVGNTGSAPGVMDQHIKAVIESVDAEAIRKKKYRVVLDPVNSAGAVITERLLKGLGCEVKLINGTVDGTFGRGTEPTPENLKHLAAVIKEFKADAAFAQDPDADRLVVADETGRVLSEENTLSLALLAAMPRHKNAAVVVNLSTSQANGDIAARFGGRLIRSKVGEANVVEKIHETGAAIGGEGNGGVIYPAVNTARDSLVGAALTLELMALTGKTLSQCAQDIPAYVMRKEKYDFKGSLDALFEKLLAAFPGAGINREDGLWLGFADGWLHVRASNTEPIVRLIAEAKEESVLDERMKKAAGLIR